ncbi:MAG: M18 family aminopeptidase [Oscillibacter sp.]|nr:M18 family aminopeptidase [Oscillibacter sp.]
MYRKIAEETLAFIQKNPTAFHTAASVQAALEEAGYQELLESGVWTLEPGKNYYVCRNGSSIIAFQTGTDLEPYSFHIAAAHTDSPSFKLKEYAAHTVGETYTTLNVEGYGGMICSTWLDRPLSIAGRALVQQEDGCIVTKLVNFDRDLVLIPSVAIHMNRSVNEGYAYNKQVDMLPLFAGEEGGSLSALLAKELDTAEGQILGSDLFLYNRDKPTVWGCNGEFLSSGRLDDQQCVFAALRGFLGASNRRSVNVLACFDNEEVGSGTKQGAASTFLQDILRRINSALGKGEEDYLRALASSFMLSADNAHAVHPNHPEHSDAENRVYLNAGVAVKSHAGQKYTTDGMSAAIVRALAKQRDIPLQFFANRSDMAGGSTLGNIAMTHVPVKCADVGLPQLAMHSCYETAGTKDTWYMVQLMEALFSSHFEEAGAGALRITE